MPSTYSPDLRIELIANGEKTGAWGAITNSNLGTILEDAIAGAVTVLVTSDEQALTVQDGAFDQARNAAIILSTALATNFSVFVPPVTKLYTIFNSSAQIATIYVSDSVGSVVPGGTGIAIPAGKTVLVRSTGEDIVEQVNHIAGNLSVAGDQAVAGNQTISGTQLVTGIATFSTSPLVPTAPDGTDNSTAANTEFVTNAVTNADYINDPNANGIMVRTADKTATPRSIAVTAGTGLAVTNGDGVSGNPTLAGVTQATALWQAGAGTVESVVSPAKISSAITALAPALVTSTTAALAAGSVGSYVWAGQTNTSYGLGATKSGSVLIPGGFAHAPYSDANAAANTYNSGALSGTWRAMGACLQNAGSGRYMTTLWLRIA